MPGSTAVEKKGDTYRSDSRKRDVRWDNLEAAKAVSDAVRTSLGPRGMDKMIVGHPSMKRRDADVRRSFQLDEKKVEQANGEVLITNDGATVLQKMEVSHPAAKMLVELSKSQDINAGDGTTSVVVLAGALLKKCMDLIEKGVHPTVISDAMNLAGEKACAILEENAIPVDLSDREALIQNATTSLGSKVVSQYSSILAPMAVDCVLGVVDPELPNKVDLKDIKLLKKLGGTVEDTEMIDGLVFEQHVSKSANGPTRVTNAKIALIQFCVSPPKTDMESNVVVSDYAQMDRILREERNYILQMVKKIKASGCNVVLIQKSILRDAVTELSLHYFAKAKIMVIKDIERDDIEFISKTLGCLPISHIDHMKPEKLGSAGLVEEVNVGSEKVVKITEIEKKGRTTTVLVRGSNKLVLEEAERSLHDALCVVRCLVQKRFLIAGGGAPEIEIARGLNNWSKTLEGMVSYCVRCFADAFEVIPYTLAENAGLNAIEIVTELRARHANGEVHTGINVRRGCITNILEENVVQPLLVSTSAVSLASECVRMILKIDDLVPVR